MKQILKLSGTLLLNQFLADIACGVCVIPFPFFFGENPFTYVLFLLLEVFFFYYISYHGAYKYGFHDVARHSSAEYDKGYIKRGIVASLCAAAPSILMWILWYIGKTFAIEGLLFFQIPLFYWGLFGSWPLVHLIPNHLASVFGLTILVQFLFPLVGYYSGYKGIVYHDKFLRLIGIKKS